MVSEGRPLSRLLPSLGAAALAVVQLTVNPRINAPGVLFRMRTLGVY